MKRIITLLFALVITHFAIAQCSPTFTYTPVPFGDFLLNVQVDNTTTFTPVGSQHAYYEIYFSDGTTWDPCWTSVVHTYATPGTYAITLRMIVIDSASGATVCTVDNTQPITVTYPSCGTLINSTIVSSSFTSEVVSFSSSTPSGSPIATYLWNFGDGSVSTLASPTHTYVTPGVMSVSLTVTGAGGCTYTNYATVLSTVVDCSIDSASLYIDASGYYSATHTPAGPFQMATYAWDFGDGTTSAYSAGYHTYTAGGTYPVTLTVSWVDSASGTVQCTASATGSVTIPPPVTNRISGYVIFNGATPMDSSIATSCKVWLITYNSATMMLEAVDSVTVPAMYNSYYEFLGAPAGNYRVKAAAQYILPTAYGYSPTYFDSSLMWSAATVINHAGLDDNNNIYMISGAVPTGSGFIGGNVTTGANKGTAGSIPAVGLLVYAVDAATNRPVQSVYTNASGDYAFSNLAYGTYYVHPELINYITTDYPVFSLSAAAPTKTAAGFVQHTLSHTITPIPAGIAEVTANNVPLAIYPNPAQDQLNISFSLPQAEDAVITITDIAGREVYNNTVALMPGTTGSGKIDIGVATFSTGLYIIKIKSASINYTTKIEVAH